MVAAGRTDRGALPAGVSQGRRNAARPGPSRACGLTGMRACRRFREIARKEGKRVVTPPCLLSFGGHGCPCRMHVSVKE